MAAALYLKPRGSCFFGGWSDSFSSLAVLPGFGNLALSSGSHTSDGIALHWLAALWKMAGQRCACEIGFQNDRLPLRVIPGMDGLM
jgi:hypothetical protein